MFLIYLLQCVVNQALVILIFDETQQQEHIPILQNNTKLLMHQENVYLFDIIFHPAFKSLVNIIILIYVIII